MLSVLALGRCYLGRVLTHLSSTKGLKFPLIKGYIYMGFSCRLPVSWTGERHSRTSSQSVVEIQRVKNYGTSRVASIPLYIP